MMKSNRFFQLVASFVLVLALTISLVACGGDIPDGKYVKSRSEKYWEFSGNKATYHLGKDHPDKKGTYEIDKDGLFIFKVEGEKPDKLLFGIEGKQLLLGSSEYTKQ